MSRAAVLLVVAALAAPATAWSSGGHGGGEEAQTSDALALQALALIELHPPPHGPALEKLEEAIEQAREGKGELGPAPLLTARDALLRGDGDAARRALEGAFPADDAHLVGVTYRPASGPAQAVAGILGAAALAFAALLLRRRSRVDRELTPG